MNKQYIIYYQTWTWVFSTGKRGIIYFFEHLKADYCQGDALFCFIDSFTCLMEFDQKLQKNDLEFVICDEYNFPFSQE